MEKFGLVLEGGGMRGIYTSGVLDFYMKKKLDFPYIIAVSAGVYQGMSYMTGQRGRSRKIYMNFSGDPRYLSGRRLIREGSIFGFDFIFGEMSRELLPFDYERFGKSPVELVIGATDCITGEPEFFYKSRLTEQEIMQAAIASSSMPLMARPIVINGRPYMDGGESDSIPIKRAIADGYKKNVVILTRDASYAKKQEPLALALMKRRYKNYPGLVKAALVRPRKYNDTLEFIRKEEAAGRAFVIRPKTPVKVGRTERSKKKLAALYMEGYEDARESCERLLNFIYKKD